MSIHNDAANSSRVLGTAEESSDGRRRHLFDVLRGVDSPPGAGAAHGVAGVGVLMRLLVFATILVLAGCATPSGGGRDEATDGEGTAAPQAGAGSTGPGDDESSDQEESSDPDRFEAIPFPDYAEWVNVDEPISLEELEGRHILLDFWTYGCINCYHMVPNLNRIHERYDGRLVVIGVHSAKFTGEQDSDNIREAVERYGIRYPVINDRRMELWQGYGVPGWPTIIMIDPKGYVIGGSPGEWSYERLAGLLDQIIDRDPDTAPPEIPQLDRAATAPEPTTRLSFPQGLQYDPSRDLLYLSDTGNNRILAVDAESGRVDATWGRGSAGLTDGPGGTAEFSRPRGLAVSGDILFVADTGNHAIRRIDLDSGEVTTLVTGGIGPTDEIRSPWDVAVSGETLYFSNAGQHQIWRLDLRTNEAEEYSGSGYEGLRDGPAAEAEFAQPSGISLDGDVLYVADPESSAIRTVDIAASGEVETIVGTGLFEFGSQDGSVDSALLMHAGDVVPTRAGVVVADTYNDRLRLIVDGIVRSITTGLNEPIALATDGERIWVADTNNHRIVAITVDDIVQGRDRYTPVSIRPGTVGNDESAAPLSFRQDILGGSFSVDLVLPEGHKLNEGSPNSLVFRGNNGMEAVIPVTSEETARQRVSLDWSRLVDAGVLDPESTRQSVTMEAWLYYCLQDNEEVCRFYSTEYQILLEDAPADGGRGDTSGSDDGSGSGNNSRADRGGAGAPAPATITVTVSG